MCLIIEELVVNLDNKYCEVFIYPDPNDDEKYADIKIRFNYKLQYTPEDVEWLDGWKRVEPADVEIIDIEFGDCTVTDGDYIPTQQEIEFVHEEVMVQMHRTDRDKLWQLLEEEC